MDVLLYVVLPLLLSLFGGGSVVALHLWIVKPRQTRKKVANVIGNEVAINLGLIQKVWKARIDHPRNLQSNFRIGTLGFEGVSSLLGELPGDLLASVTSCYHNFAELTLLHSICLSQWDEKYDTPPGSRERQRATERLKRSLSVFDKGLEASYREAQLLLEELGKETKSTWKVRGEELPAPHQAVPALINGGERTAVVRDWGKWQELIESNLRHLGAPDEMVGNVLERLKEHWFEHHADSRTFSVEHPPSLMLTESQTKELNDNIQAAFKGLDRGIERRMHSLFIERVLLEIRLWKLQHQRGF